MYSPILLVVSNTMQKKKNDKKSKSWTDQRNKQYAKREKNGTIGPIQSLGGVGGAVLGSAFGPAGSAAGFALGSAVGKGIGYITGSGDYAISRGQSVPSFSKEEATTITHREYIADIVSGTGTPSAFSIAKLAINPGDPNSFPWLSSIAINYEEYELLGLVYEFISTSGDSVGSTTTSLGTVIMATQYDPTKPAFDTKQGMENYFFSQSAKPSCNIMHAVELKKSQTPVKNLYVRSNPNVGDLRWTDFGNFYIATVGMQAPSVNLGELWVSYKVRLRKPRLPTTVSGGYIRSSTSFNLSATSAAPLGSGSGFKGNMIVTSAGNTLTWQVNPASVYLVMFKWTSTATAQVISAGPFINCVQTNTFENATQSIEQANVPSTNVMWAVTVKSTTTGGGDAFASITLATTIVGSCNVVIMVTQLDDAFGL